MDISLFEVFSYDFMRNGLIAGILVALCGALLGVNLVLKRYSMIGDGLSHVGFGALAIAFALNIAPLWLALPVMIAAAFLLMRIKSSGIIKGDAAIAMISTGAMAVGIIAVSLTTGITSDVYSYMFGSVLSVSDTDMLISIIAAAVVLTVYFVFYNKIFAVTFDENFAKATGQKVNAYNMLLAVLTAVIIVIGMKIMGALLFSALIVFPALTSMRVFKTYKAVIVSSAVISVSCFFLGMTLSFYLSLPSGASIVIINIIAFAVFALIKLIKTKR